jgi:flagellar basal-body rod modification protein FlgD
MATQPVASVGSASGIRDQYMNLLVTQLRNQNPLEPMDNAQMSSQLAQLAQLEQMENMNGTFAKVLASQQMLQASSMLNKQVSYLSGDGQSVATGKVTRADFLDGEVVLTVGDQRIPAANVLSVNN